MPTTDDVDDASPMERKVLHWLSQVPLIRDLEHIPLTFTRTPHA
jgi:hypothetical protein